ncbi:UPF0390 protein [Penicillium oxalicum]|uniref:Uncharacterized protein n=1 Tax=Penicillium oxalicum (strain 114-2 / CGMCC 5302) TaxID=933388 RepID=S8B0N3_PENO1|nr:UPF0390 protein [Penicillium oxalicum]EPS27862.1 hypothetical protein PDE_02806 [Penicillium oxalicum 114-2]KAI2788821.1 UPF0390 protein [Penicillium oxalicum]
MAQGLLKKSKPASATAKRSSAAAAKMKRGPRQIAPKKQALIRQAKMTKKLTSGLVTKTERSLATKAGHLELLAGGKKDRNAEKAKAKK